MNKNTITVIKDVYKRGGRANAHLNKMWVGAADYLTAAQFEAMANHYKVGLPAQEVADVERLKGIAKRYKALFPKDDPSTEDLDESKSINFTTAKWDKHSLNNINRMSWYESVAELILKGYGSGSDAFGPTGTVDDLLVLTEDIKPLLDALSMVHPDTKDVHKKRFREANIFMPGGNGDKAMNLPETAVYIGYLQSIGKRANIMIDRLKKVSQCAPKGDDLKTGTPTYDIDCFRAAYFGNDFENYWDVFPALVNEYKTYTAEQRTRFAYAYEAAAKIPTYNNDPVSEFDMSSFSGIPHYVETIVYRFDMNKDGLFDRDEVLNDIFPVFYNELTGFTNKTSKLLNKGILLWLIQKGRSPFKCAKKPTVQEILDVIGWLVTGGPFKGFKANRLSLYEVFATLGLPNPPGCPVPESASSTLGVETIDTDRNGYDEVIEYFPDEI